MEQNPVIIFTAFEPSGDAHAAPVIARLRARLPEARIYAWGGAAMEAAGAALVANTAEDGAMGLSAFSRIATVRRQVKGIREWCRAHRVLAHVAVDSPAANFPICKFTRKQGARVAHLVAPQLWAWGPWRARKLRSRTDLVMCLLPFEEPWFRERKIPAKFIGHPRINREIDDAEVAERAHRLPSGAPRIAIFPGSREHEVKKNIKLLVHVFSGIRDRHPKATGVIVLARPDLADIVRSRVDRLPHGLHLTSGGHENDAPGVDGAIAWSDLALAVSGTITLDLTRQHAPMIGVYKTSAFACLLSKIVLRTPYRLLPNIIAERGIVPEFVPHAGGAGPVVAAAERLLNDSKNLATQSAELERVCLRYAHKTPDDEAARLIVRLVQDGRVE